MGFQLISSHTYSMCKLIKSLQTQSTLLRYQTRGNPITISHFLTSFYLLLTPSPPNHCYFNPAILHYISSAILKNLYPIPHLLLPPHPSKSLSFCNLFHYLMSIIKQKITLFPHSQHQHWIAGECDDKKETACLLA